MWADAAAAVGAVAAVAVDGIASSCAPSTHSCSPDSHSRSAPPHPGPRSPPNPRRAVRAPDQCWST